MGGSRYDHRGSHSLQVQTISISARFTCIQNEYFFNFYEKKGGREIVSTRYQQECIKMGE